MEQVNSFGASGNQVWQPVTVFTYPQTAIKKKEKKKKKALRRPYRKLKKVKFQCKVPIGFYREDIESIVTGNITNCWASHTCIFYLGVLTAAQVYSGIQDIQEPWFLFGHLLPWLRCSVQHSKTANICKLIGCCLFFFKLSIGVGRLQSKHPAAPLNEDQQHLSRWGSTQNCTIWRGGSPSPQVSCLNVMFPF